MAVEDIKSKLNEIIVEQLNADVEKITEDAKFTDDLGADSLDVVELVMAIEEKFEVDIPDEDAENIQTVGDVVKYLKDKVA